MKDDDRFAIVSNLQISLQKFSIAKYEIPGQGGYDSIMNEQVTGTKDRCAYIFRLYSTISESHIFIYKADPNVKDTIFRKFVVCI